MLEQVINILASPREAFRVLRERRSLAVSASIVAAPLVLILGLGILAAR
jgi:hypothetical protein